MSATPNQPEKAEPIKKKKRTFDSAAGDKVRAEHRRVGLIGTLVAGALGGGAYGIHRSAEKFLPTETRKALEETENVFNRMSMSRALSGHKANYDDVIENYATQASRLANAEAAGMQGRELVKLLRTRLPVKNKWHPFVSDAHYDAFARGPAYGAAQLIDEHAVSMANRPSVDKKLKQYLVDKWPEKYSEKVNATALDIAGKKMDIGPSLRESLAYGGDTVAADKQPAITKEIIRGSLFNKDRIPVFGGFSDHYKDLKKDLANGLMGSSFQNYIGLGHKAKGVHSALKYTLPALVGAAGIGVGGYGLMKLIKSMKRTTYEKRMMEKAEREGKDDDEDQAEKSAMIKQEGDEWVLYTSDGDRVLGRHSTAKKAYAQEYAIRKSHEKSAAVLNSIRNLINLQPKVRSIASLTKVPEEFEQLNTNIHGLLNAAGISSPEFTPDVNETVTHLIDKLGLNNYPAEPKSTAQPMAKNASTLARLRKARNATHTQPTPSQAHEGNYRKGAFKFQGMKIKIENPNDTTRKGYNKDGEEIWSRVMKADYGYFVGTTAVDGDAVDCFIGSNLDSELVVAVDQYKGDKFDETKFILGCDSQAEGEKLYMAHYPKGWTLGPVSTCTTQQLKMWLKEGNTKKPFAGQQKEARGMSILVKNLQKGMKWMDVADAPSAISKVKDTAAPKTLWRGHEALSPTVERVDKSVFSVANARNAAPGTDDLLHATPIPREAMGYGSGFGLQPGQRIKPGRKLNYDAKLVSRYPAGPATAYGPGGSVLGASGKPWNSLDPESMLTHAAYEAPLTRGIRPESTGLLRRAGDSLQYAELSGTPEWARIQKAIARRPSLLDSFRNAPEWNLAKAAALERQKAAGRLPPGLRMATKELGNGALSSAIVAKGNGG